MSLEELQGNLQEYKQQSDQLEQLLLAEPNNTEYAEIYRSLTEAIELTEDLIREAEAAPPEALAAAQHTQQAQQERVSAAALPRDEEVVTQAPSIVLSSILPLQVAQQIRAAQQRAALAGQAPAAWAIGAKCSAVYSVDGEWYPGTITGVTTAGNYVVQFEAYNNTEQVERAHVRPPPELDEVYRGVAAPARGKVEAEPKVESGEMPRWMEVRAADDQKTVARKKKLQKSFKSKQRFQRMDAATKDRQKSWLDFKSGKGAKKKTGFLTSTKKGSIFSVPEGAGGKVGVVGSGRGMTDFQDARRHDHREG